MTDEEIIKALECCIPNDEEKCLACPFFRECIKQDKNHLAEYALDLINRQKAEIDKLKIENCALSEKRITFPERLKIVKHARNHALKEMADDLIAIGYGIHGSGFVCEGDIKDVLKEMTKECEENGK